MSVRNQIYESVWSDRWCLAGSVTTSPLFITAGHSLKLIRDIDALTPMIRSAMDSKSTIPVVEINTPNGMLTLTNAEIVNIAPLGPRAGRKHGKPLGTHELTEFEITFARITISHKSRKGLLTDDWSSGG